MSSRVHRGDHGTLEVVGNAPPPPGPARRRRAVRDPRHPETEAQFQKWIMDVARWHGWLAVHYRPARRGSHGWSTPVQGDAGGPDLLLARSGRVLLVEVKAQRGTRTTQQKRWAAEIGGAYRLWRPSDRPEIERELTLRAGDLL